MLNFFRKVPLYPFLTAIYPILYLLSVNIKEIEPETGLRSGLLFLFFSLVTFMIVLLATKEVHKSALASFIITLVFFLVFFLIYAPAYRTLREVHFFGETIGRHRYLVMATFVLLVATGFLVIRLCKKIKSNTLRSITRVLNFFTILLVLVPLFTMISYEIKKQKNQVVAQMNLPPVEQKIVTATSNSPDIYYLIFDMHTSDEVMRQLMDYDNSAFTSALKERGFKVTNCSRSNYANTQLSITSSLNMNYIQDMTDSYDIPSLYPLIQSSLVQRTLEEAGYHIYAFESGYPFTELRGADRYFSPVSGALDLLTYPGVTAFESLIMRISGGKILYESREQLSQEMQYIIDAPYVEYRNRILYTLDGLSTLPVEPEPKFVFAHILAPHDPFVFDENGNATFRRTPFQMDRDPEFGKGYGWNSYREGYVEEITYLHKRILEIVDELQAKSNTPPVIVIQGDHGLPRLGLVGAQYEIYNAYYPGSAGTALFYDTVTPVNTFRLLFNTLFDSQYAMLPDKMFLLGGNGLFEVFDESPTCPAVFDSLPTNGEDQVSDDL